MDDRNGLPSFEDSRRRARLGALVTAVASILYSVVLIIILLASHISLDDKELNKVEFSRHYRTLPISSGIVYVSFFLVTCSLTHALLAFLLRNGLLGDPLWHAGAWVRCHAVWLVSLALGGAFLCYSFVTAHAPGAAGGLVAATLAAAVLGALGAVALRRHLALLFGGPWWVLCNLPDFCCTRWWRPAASVRHVEPYAATVGGAPVTVQGGPAAPFRPKHTHPDFV